MRIIVIEEDDDRDIKVPLIHRPGRRGFESWICPYCGKRVYSMEVHSCNQPWCGGKFIYEEEHPEDGPFCWNYGGNK